MGWERGRDVTITYAKGIHDRAPISRPHKCKNGDWDNTTHNRKLVIRGKANTIGKLYKIFANRTAPLPFQSLWSTTWLRRQLSRPNIRTNSFGGDCEETEQN
jgi:hypothetical protein